jgi:HNH endonuclease
VNTPVACELCGTPTESKYGLCRKTRECNREYMRRYYEANAAAVLAQPARQNAANREKKRRGTAAWHAANPEKARALSAAWRKANRDAILEQRRTYDAAYRTANRDAKKKQNAAYHRANRARATSRNNARRARRSAAQVAGPVPLKVYETIMASGPCVYCGDVATTVDHVRPLIQGGWEHESNLVPACRFCNFSKGPRLLTEWRLPDRVTYGIEHSPKVAAEYERLMEEAA